MLMALLYCDENQIAAAAPACDQMPYGDQYWYEIFGGELTPGPMFETAYVFIADSGLRKKLLLLGFDEHIDGEVLAEQIASSASPSYLPGQAA